MIIQATEAGLYANICDYLRHAYICVNDCKPFMALWSTNSLYYDKTRGTNVFEYFFDQPYAVGDVVSEPPRIVQGYIPLDISGEQFRRAMHMLQAKFLKYNQTMQQIIDRAAAGTGVSNKTLGVHIRYTDKHLTHVYGEPPSAKPISASQYIEVARKALDKFNFDNIFLATDDAPVLNLFELAFGEKLVYLDVPRSSSNEAIHTGMRHISGFIKGASVIADVEMLSRCGYLIRSTSNVSSFAQFKNISLEHLNLNEVILGDNREQDFGLTSTNYEGLL